MEIKNCLIFIVEDNKVYNKLITEYLARHKYIKVKSFYSGVECIEAVKSGNIPDIVIQDYFLEKMNGVEVLQKIKKISSVPEFIFLTNNEDLSVAVNTIKFGAYDYIIKDEMALQKMHDRIKKITRIKFLEKRNKDIRKFIYMASGVIVLIIIFAILYFVFDIFGMNT